METEHMMAALATYFVREIERMLPVRPMGRSRLQKLFYLLSREGHVRLAFDLFMNGPYSESVENALCLAVEAGMVTAVKEHGRSSISARGGVSVDIPMEIKERANCCIRSYGLYDEMDLAILTTAFFLEDRIGLGPEELIMSVLEVNPHFDPRRVCSLLDRSEILFRSW
ncbi:MAG TPA: hypothetical protein VGK23_08130 [Methanomassiliicoccales archaeon]